MNIINQKDNTDVYSTSDVSQSPVDNSTLLTGTLSLPEDHHYWVNIAINIGNNYIRVSNDIYLSTFDVQGVKVVNVTNGEICLDIKYVPGSVATGCSVNLECSYDSISSIRDISFNGHYTCSQFATINKEKSFDLKAYDEVNNVIKRENGPAVEVNNITIVPAVSPSSLIHSTSASIISTLTPSISITGDSTVEVIYGIVPVLIVFIITIAAAIFVIVTYMYIKRKVSINYTNFG
jgi:hypothetical protein